MQREGGNLFKAHLVVPGFRHVAKQTAVQGDGGDGRVRYAVPVPAEGSQHRKRETEGIQNEGPAEIVQRFETEFDGLGNVDAAGVFVERGAVQIGHDGPAFGETGTADEGLERRADVGRESLRHEGFRGG